MIDTTSTAVELFEDAIKSKYTLKVYRERLEQFLKFTKIRDYQALAQMPPKEIENLIIIFVRDLKKKSRKKRIWPQCDCSEIKSNLFVLCSK